MYEELLLSGNPCSTKHSKIFRSKEPFIQLDELIREINSLKELMQKNDFEKHEEQNNDLPIKVMSYEVYLENYNMWLGKLITSGVDVWLNTPLRPNEASGTSGMKAALNGIPNFANAIALKHKDEIISGLIFDPIKDEMFFSEKDKGAYLNNQRLRVSKKNTIEDCLFSSNHEGVKFSTLNMRCTGCAALDLSLIHI